MQAPVWAGYQNVVQVNQHKWQAPQQLVHEALKSHSSILQPEWHPKEFKETKRSDDGRLLYIRGVDRNLVVALLEVELAEDSGPPPGCW